MTMTKAAAALIALAFLVGSGVMLYCFGLNTPDKGNWDHAVIVYNALTSVGFTAIGVLLGTQVQQVNVANAKAETKDAKADGNKKATAIRGAVDALGHPAAASADEAGGGVTPVANARSLLLASLS